jgi:ParB family chromosome partitioning protein
MTIDQIEVSRFNVRRHRKDIVELSAMEASILGRGLIQPLNVHPMLGSKKFGAFAGGRRARSIKNLVARGDLPADWPVRVEVYRGYSDIEIIELSLGENIQRRDLQDYEVCAAVASLAAKGESAEAIAIALGQPLDRVRRQMRVGQLAPPIFETLSQGELSIDAARAYAATADQQLQLATFEQLRNLDPYLRTPEKIRAAMKIGDRAGLRRLRLVGDDAYRAAGGRFELDLFADEAEQRGRVVDEGLLAKLAQERLEQVKVQTRLSTRPDLRFVDAPPRNGYGGTDETLRASVRAKVGGGLEIADGVVAWVDVTESGEPQVSYWWESRKAKHGSPAGKAETRASAPRAEGAAALTDPYTYGQPAKAAAREEHGVSAEALFAIRAVRRETLRALIVEDAQRGGEVGRSYAVWAQLRTLLTRQQVGLRAANPSDHEVGTTTAGFELARERVEEQQAHCVWTAAVKDLAAETFMTEADHDAAFINFLNAGEQHRRLAGAVLAGLLLERSAAAPGFDHRAHAAVAAMTRGTPATIRTLWSPTAEFLALFPKAQQLAIAEPLIDAGSLARWSKAKADELTILLAQALNGAGHAVPRRCRAAADDWVHPLLAFTPPQEGGGVGDPGPADESVVLELIEAAE